MSQQQTFNENSIPVMPNVQFLKGNDGVSVGPDPVSHIINLVGNTTQGVSVSGNAGTFTETITVADATFTQKGVVTLNTIVIAPAYKNVNHANGDPGSGGYAVLATDYYISIDGSGGTVQITLPLAPTNYRQYVVKDRLGQATTNVLTITVDGVITIDGATTYTLTDNYEAVQLLWNGTSWETF